MCCSVHSCALLVGSCFALLLSNAVSIAGAPQAVLQLGGASAEGEELNWGRMRILTTYKMVKRLTEIKPSEVPHKVGDCCSAASQLHA